MAEYLFGLAIEFREEKDFLFPNEQVIEITEDIWRMQFNRATN